MLLQDVFVIDKLTVVNEGKANSSMKIRGVFQRADEANANKRIYRKSILENSIKSLKPLIEGRMLVGELDHPDANIVRLQNASHVITNLKMVGNEMIGEAEILSTPAGQVVKALISDGVKIGVSSRGMGTISEDKDGVKYVNEDFKLVTFDIVADPSTRGAYPGLTESKKVDMDETIKKAFGEKVLLALLKENLDEGSLGAKRIGRVSNSLAAEDYHGKKWDKFSAVSRYKKSKQLHKDRKIEAPKIKSNENSQITIESLKQRILDMSVISEGSMSRKRLERTLKHKTTPAERLKTHHPRVLHKIENARARLEKRHIQNRLKVDTNNSLSRYSQMQKDHEASKKKIRHDGDQPEMYESDEHRQLTIESLKQEILNRSRIKKD